MIALLTGVVSESMFQKNQVRQEEERKEHCERRKLLQQQSELLFAEVKDQETGEATIEDVKELALDIEEMFSNLGIEFEYADLDNFSGLIDTDGSGSISQQEFQHGILSMAHGTQSMSTMELYYHLCILKAKLDRSEPVWQHASESAQKLSISVDHFATSLRKIVDVQQDLSHQNKEMMQTKASILTTLQQFNDKFACMLEAQDRVEKQASQVQACVKATGELKETVAVFHQDFLTLHEDTALFHTEMSDFLVQAGHKQCSMQCSTSGEAPEDISQSMLDCCSDTVTHLGRLQDANVSCPPTHASSVQLNTNHDTWKENAECIMRSGTAKPSTGTQSRIDDLEKCRRPSRRLTSRADLAKMAICAEIKDHLQSEVQRSSEKWYMQTPPVTNPPACQIASDSFRMGSVSCSTTAVETQQLIRQLIESQQTTFKNMTAQVDAIVSGQQHIQTDMQNLCATLKDASCLARAAQTCQ